jgi:hypothetical protein
MSNQNVYSVVKGLSENVCRFIGRVAEEPYVTETMAVIKLNTVATEMGKNKQLIDTIQTVPITIIDKAKVDSVKKYVKKGKQIQVWCYYKTWDDGSKHALIATKIKYGPDEYKPDQGFPGSNKKDDSLPDIPVG